MDVCDLLTLALARGIMDPVSGAASFIAVVQITGKLLKLSLNYCSEAKETKREIRDFRNEVIALHDILIDLRDRVNSTNGAQLPALDVPMKQCLSTLEELATKLDPGESKDKKKKLIVRALTWPFSSNDVKKAIIAIDRHKNTFNLALTAEQTYSFLIRLLYQELLC